MKPKKRGCCRFPVPKHLTASLSVDGGPGDDQFHPSVFNDRDKLFVFLIWSRHDSVLTFVGTGGYGRIERLGSRIQAAPAMLACSFCVVRNHFFTEMVFGNVITSIDGNKGSAGIGRVFIVGDVDKLGGGVVVSVVGIWDGQAYRRAAWSRIIIVKAASKNVLESTL